MDVLRNQQSKPQHIFKKLLKENSRFFLWIFSNLESVRFFSKHISLKYVSNIFLENKVIKKVWRLFCFVGDVCLTRSQSLQLFLFSCALFVVAFIELSLSLFVLFSLFENAYRCLLNIRSSMLLFFSSQCFYFWFCSHCVK